MDDIQTINITANQYLNEDHKDILALPCCTIEITYYDTQ